VDLVVRVETRRHHDHVRECPTHEGVASDEHTHGHRDAIVAQAEGLLSAFTRRESHVTRGIDRWARGRLARPFRHGRGEHDGGDVEPGARKLGLGGPAHTEH
jgi:hypothetical protein